MDTRSLPEIIEDTFSGKSGSKPLPTIVNPVSKFVVSTYWWGGDNLNKNTARPCQSYFENLLHRFVGVCVDILVGRTKSDGIAYLAVKLALVQSPKYKNLLQNETKIYYLQMADHFKIPVDARKAKHTDTKPLQQLIPLLQGKMAQESRKPGAFVFQEFEQTVQFISMMLEEALSVILELLFELTAVTKQVNAIKTEHAIQKKIKIIMQSNTQETRKEIAELRKTYSDQELKVIRSKQYVPLINTANEKKRGIIIQINQLLNKQRMYTNDTLAKDPTYNFNEMRPSIYNGLHEHLRFVAPISYRDMITGWEQTCVESNCNYLAVEFPEFTVKGGYQLAINAKPLFIKSALQCLKDNKEPDQEARAVVYIDGDMYIRKYPNLFDMPDVDYMARGWWTDPRSSEFMNAVTYDPYLFETSGGIMYFSQSFESTALINYWVKVSTTVSQQGKADDRLISLIFNTKKLLLPMKMIQLPIEFLWLTLDYNDRLLDTPVYWKKNKNDPTEPSSEEKMEQSIIVEHPECLTTEDTASSSGGASSDRNPKFYQYLEEEIDPVSEQLHEYLMFPSRKYMEDFADYLGFMKTLPYANNDWQDVLLKRKWISYSDQKDPFENWEESEDNVKPLTVIPYDDQWGDAGNEVVAENEQYISKVDISKYPEDQVELPFSEDAIPLIIRLLQENKTVIYNPTTAPGYDITFYNEYTEKSPSLQRMELIFTPELDQTKSPHFMMVPKIQTNQVMVFRPNDILIKFLKMFYTLDAFSKQVENGVYQLISRIRVAYIIPSKKKTFKGEIVTGRIRLGPEVEVPPAPPLTLPKPAPEKPLYSAMVGGGTKETEHRHISEYRNAMNILYSL